MNREITGMKYFIELPEVWVTEFLENDPLCDGYWISSLTQSWQKGYPDNSTLPWTNYVDVVRRLRFHTRKKIIVDVDMLYNEPSIAAVVARELHDAGCDAVVVESKRFPKVNSLRPDAMVLSTPEEFARLLNKVSSAVPGLEIIARIEYLAKTRDVAATCRISRRVVDAGADAVVVHWGADDNTRLLKETLSCLKTGKVTTGIIPTRYLDQITAGEFDALADFCILGNICSSYIRHAFSQQNVHRLLDIPCMFEPILDRVKHHEPVGQKTLVVLGAVATGNGVFLLSDETVVERFLEMKNDFYAIVFVVGADAPAVPVTESGRLRVVRVAETLGEVHSVSFAMPYLNTEFATVVYADIDDFGFSHLGAEGMLFQEDTYAGVMTLASDLLTAMVQKIDPTASMLRLGMDAALPATVITRGDTP